MLHPLYQAVREYLEIKSRVQVLNERCRVFLDLAEILSDSIADTKMTRKSRTTITLPLMSADSRNRDNLDHYRSDHRIDSGDLLRSLSPFRHSFSW